MNDSNDGFSGMSWYRRISSPHDMKVCRHCKYYHKMVSVKKDDYSIEWCSKEEEAINYCFYCYRRKYVEERLKILGKTV